MFYPRLHLQAVNPVKINPLQEQHEKNYILFIIFFFIKSVSQQIQPYAKLVIELC